MTVKDINVPDKNGGDLISRQAAKKKACSICRWKGTDNCSECEHPIDDLPTIDAVSVTRCRDCKHRKAKTGDCYGNGLVLCNDGVWRDMEFFCADGERSEE